MHLMTAYATNRCTAVQIWQMKVKLPFFPPLTHLKIFIEQSQF